MAAPPPDRVLAGRYRLRVVLGHGGMGRVWHADDELLGREVAVKEVLLPPGLDESAAAELHRRLLREARAAARLDHPGIVGIHDVVEEAGRPCIIMQLVRGRSVAETIREDGPLPPRRVAGIGLNLLDALETAHAQGVLHRDVTPRNVLLSTGGRVVLTDFGIAAVAGATRLTQPGALIGSPGYIAPERLRGDDPGPESDLWSLGATLYHAVEGRPAYEAKELVALIGAVLTREPVPPARAGPLTPIVMGLLAGEPSDRLAARAARHALTRVAVGETPGQPVVAVSRPSPPVATTAAARAPSTAHPPVRSSAGAGRPDAPVPAMAPAEPVPAGAAPGPPLPGVEITGSPLRAFYWSSLVSGIPMTVLFALTALVRQGGVSGAPKLQWLIPVGAALLVGLLMAAMSRTLRATFGPVGLTLRSKGASWTIPEAAIRGVGIARRLAHGHLTVWYDPSAAPAPARAFEPLVKRGRRTTGDNGAVALQSMLLLSDARLDAVWRHAGYRALAWVEQVGQRRRTD